MNLRKRIASVESLMRNRSKDPRDMSLDEITHELAMLSTPADLKKSLKGWDVEMAAICEARLTEKEKFPWLLTLARSRLGTHGRGCHRDEFVSQSRANIEVEWTRLKMHGRSSDVNRWNRS